jgi:hypothetical protein
LVSIANCTMYVAPGLEVQEIGRELLALLYVPRVTVGEAVPAPRNCLRDSFIPDILLGMFVPIDILSPIEVV